MTNDGLHSYSYDAVNRIVSVDGGATAQHTYDHKNCRVKKVSGGNTTHYIWEGDHVLAEHNGSSGAVITDYVYNGGKIIATLVSGSTRYVISDRMSGRLLLDGSANLIGREAHLPFGEDFGESGTQEKHHFTSYERDSETGNDYAVNRSYSPNVGRFLSADPYSPTGGTNDPRNWNRYSYARNVVINRADPLGLVDGPIEGGCPPAGTPGTWPGQCLCQVVPELCSRRFGPPNLDGNSDGRGNGQPVEGPLIFFDKAAWDIVSVPFVGNLSAEIPLSGNACQGTLFSVSVYFRVLNPLGDLYVNEVVTVDKDGGFDIQEARDHHNGGDGTFRKDISLNRKRGGAQRGIINIKVKTLGKDRQPAERSGVVVLKCK